MLSNKLTFSLASLVVLIALALIATPVMAQVTKPTATIEAVDVSEIRRPAVDADATATPPVAEFNPEIEFKVTFSDVIDISGSGATTFDEGDVSLFALDSMGTPGTAVLTTTPTITVEADPDHRDTTAGVRARVFMITISETDATESIVDDAARGIRVQITAAQVTVAQGPNTGNTNDLIRVDFTNLPSVLGDTTVKVTGPAELADPFTVTLTFSADPDPAPAMTDLDVMPEGATVGTPTVDDTDSMKYTVEISNIPFGTDSVTVSLPTSYVKGGGSVTVPPKEAPPPAADAPVVEGKSSPKGMIAANSFGVLQKAAAGNGVTTDDLLSGGISVDLEEFFLNGGKILLLAPAAAEATAKDVVISEIMWGSDGDSMDSQWIELYNTTDEDIAVDGWTLEFLAPNGRSGAAATDVEVDIVTNLGPIGYWAPLGQAGRTTSTSEGGVRLPAVDLISMYRNIDYAKIEKATPDLSGVPDGRVAASWKASERPSVNLTGRRIGTPGAKHHVRLSSTATSLSQSVIINEVGNGQGDSNDWVEILNTTGSEINLKKWELSIVTGTDAAPKDDKLLEFPDNDNTKLPANGILLITNTDPSNSGNDIAAGVKVDVNVDDQVKRGVSALYYVAPDLKLPDDGKFLLVLRNAIDKNSKPEAIIDAGGVLFLEVVNTTFNTQVFPLQATAKGHGNVIDAADEAFSSGQVYQRNAKNSGIGEKHWKKIGWTGIGYDRTASADDSNGGTPGYPNNGLKEKIADISGAEITISEVMFDSGAGRRQLAQWIELYNSSMTQAVNLNGWKLDIQNANSEDVDSRLNATITFGRNITVAPNQTVLIVTTSGLNSGSNHFPSTRLVNLWTTTAHREALEMTNRNDKVLSSEGFYLMLTDKDKKMVDEVGNLDGDKKTQDEPAWALPMSSEEGRRSSIIRVYQEGIALDGTTSSGWVSASDTSLAFAISHTYFGSADDFGTPGFRGGGPLPVSLSSFRPARDKATGEVVIRWITQSELNNAGFNILRSETKTGEFKVVNTKGIIPGHGTTSEKHVYTWTDTTAKPNVVYYYQIEDVSLDGKRTTLRTTHLRGNVNAAGKVTTTWGDLKTQQ